METSVNSSFRLTFYRRPSFLLMCLSFGIVLAMNLRELGLSAHTSAPILTPLYLFHTLLMAIGSMAFVTTISELGKAQTPVGEISPQESSAPAGLTIGGQQIWIWAMIGLGVIFPAIFLISPHLFTYLALEDGIVETIEAFTYFIAVSVLIAMAVGLRRYRGPYHALLITLALGGAFVLFVMGGEEISWGQRIFNIDTPAIFAGNHQREMNLHNFSTNVTETIAYSLSMIWLVLIPFINDRTGIFNKLRPIAIFIPGRFLIFVGALATTYYFTIWEWEIDPMVLYFFIMLFVLMYYMRVDCRSEASKGMLTILLILLVASQVIFIALSKNLGRAWDLKEYRELFIPLGYLAYTLDLFARMRRLTRGEAAQPA